MSDGNFDGTSTKLIGTWTIPYLLLFLRDGVCYGDELEERLHALGLDGMRLEEMHQSLRKLEWEGLVRCDRENDGDGISGLRCEVTEVGLAYLEFWANSLTQYREEMALFLDAYTAMPARGVRG